MISRRPFSWIYYFLKSISRIPTSWIEPFPEISNIPNSNFPKSNFPKYLISRIPTSRSPISQINFYMNFVRIWKNWTSGNRSSDIGIRDIRCFGKWSYSGYWHSGYWLWEIVYSGKWPSGNIPTRQLWYNSITIMVQL